MLRSDPREMTCIINFNNLGSVARRLVNANRWLRDVKTYRFPWYLSLVSANHASSNRGQGDLFTSITCKLSKQKGSIIIKHGTLIPSTVPHSHPVRHPGVKLLSFH